MTAQARKRSRKPRTARAACNKLVALLDSAERIMLAARRRGATALGPTGRAIIEKWFQERRRYEGCEGLCEFCPLRPRHQPASRVARQAPRDQRP
jgi:hypothetical protein